MLPTSIFANDKRTDALFDQHINEAATDRVPAVLDAAVALFAP